MNRTPEPNEIYQHFKGNLYRVITLAKHADTGESMVIYQALYGAFEVFARPLADFTGKVDRIKYPDAAAEYRFTLLPQIVGQAQDAARPQSIDQVQDAARQQNDARPRQAAPSEAALAHPAPATEAIPETAPPAQDAQPDPAPEEEPSLDPMLLAFLDAETYEEKLAIFTDMRGRATDDMLTTIAVSLDIDLKEGELEERYEELKNCIVMLERFECNRFR